MLLPALEDAQEHLHVLERQLPVLDLELVLQLVDLGHGTIEEGHRSRMSYRASPRHGITLEKVKQGSVTDLAHKVLDHLLALG